MLLPRNQHGCPFLILALWKGLGMQPLEKAIATIGGFDEAVRDFIRVPQNPHIPHLQFNMILMSSPPPLLQPS